MKIQDRVLIIRLNNKRNEPAIDSLSKICIFNHSQEWLFLCQAISSLI